MNKSFNRTQEAQHPPVTILNSVIKTSSAPTEATRTVPFIPTHLFANNNSANSPLVFLMQTFLIKFFLIQCAFHHFLSTVSFFSLQNTRPGTPWCPFLASARRQLTPVLVMPSASHTWHFPTSSCPILPFPT